MRAGFKLVPRKERDEFGNTLVEEPSNEVKAQTLRTLLFDD